MDYKNTYESNIKEYTVTELSNALKKTLEVNFDIIHLRGEVSGLTTASSGHVYLSLKDKNNSLIDGIIWKGQANRINFKLEDGMEVLVIGRLSTYAPRSKYNIIINSIEIAGEGALLKLIEERRRLFAEEGLFNEEYKKPLPFIPEVIGIVTTDSGAAFDDIIVRIRKRFPVKILFYPVSVQGPEAAGQISKAIKSINNLPQLNKSIQVPDILIVGRGGGSLEDLMAFNEEEVVRAIFESEIPVISAVGHEIDTTLADLVADCRAPTPSAGAEMAVKDGEVLKDQLKMKMESIFLSTKGLLAGLRIQMDKANAQFIGFEDVIVDPIRQSIGRTADELESGIQLLMAGARKDVASVASVMDALSPLGTLTRGYALPRDPQGKILRKVEDIPAGTRFSLKVANGVVGCESLGVEASD